MALVSMGVYVFKKAVLLESLRAVCGSGAGTDFGHDVIPELIRSARVFAYDFRDKVQNTPRYWRDIGTIDAYHTASMDLVQTDALFDPYANDQWPSQPTRHPSPANGAHTPARVHAASQATRTVLSPGVQVEQGATVCELVLMPGVRVGRGAHLRRAIVEEGVHIPADFRAGFDLKRDRELHTVTESGIVVINHQDCVRITPPILKFAFSKTGTARTKEHAVAVRARA
jgi:glucose-1-phosphate adenylyltransferase